MQHRPGSDRLHQVAPTPDHAQRKSVGDRLPEDREIGRNPEQRLRPAERDAEAGDHLVEDEDGVIAVAPLPDRLDIPRPGGDDPGVAQDRLQDHRGDLPTVHLHRRPQRLRVVPGQDDDVLERRAGLAPGARYRGGDGPLGVRRLPDVDRVQPAVVVALEPRDLPPAGGRAGDADRRVDRLGPGRAKPHDLDRGDRGHDALSDLDLQGVGASEDQPPADRVDDRPGHPGVGMPEDDGPHPADVVDVRVAVDILEDGPVGPGEHQRGGPLGQADVAVHAPGQHPPRAPQILFGLA